MSVATLEHQHTTTSCPCDCHGHSSTYGFCSVSGGCGHLHRDEPSQRCARDRRCDDALTTQETQPDGSAHRVRVPQWAVAPGLLCRHCTTLTRSAIAALPSDYHALGEMLGRDYGTGGEPVGGTRELPIPLRVGVDALQQMIVEEVTRWVEVVVWIPWTLSQHPDRALAAAAPVLADRLDELLTLPPTEQQRWDPTEELMSGGTPTVLVEESGMDGAIRLLDLHQRVAMVVGRTKRTRRLYTPCPRPNCQRLTLQHEEGANHVDCTACHHRMPYSEYEDRAGVLARANEHTRPRVIPRAHTPAPPDKPIVWGDGTVHHRDDDRSNMRLPVGQRFQEAG